MHTTKYYDVISWKSNYCQSFDTNRKVQESSKEHTQADESEATLSQCELRLQMCPKYLRETWLASGNAFVEAVR